VDKIDKQGTIMLLLPEKENVGKLNIKVYFNKLANTY